MSAATHQPTTDAASHAALLWMLVRRILLLLLLLLVCVLYMLRLQQLLLLLLSVIQMIFINHIRINHLGVRRACDHIVDQLLVRVVVVAIFVVVAVIVFNKFTIIVLIDILVGRHLLFVDIFETNVGPSASAAVAAAQYTGGRRNTSMPAEQKFLRMTMLPLATLIISAGCVPSSCTNIRILQ